MDESKGGPAPQQDFYVPYLPVSARQKRFLRFVGPAVLWVFVVASLVAAYSQSSPGSGVWETGVARSFHGTMHALPYPALFTDDRGDGRPGMLLLVEMGKHGCARAASFDGATVEVGGWPVHREGRWMLELEPGDAGIRRSTQHTPGPTLLAQALGRVTLHGEIVDSKCFLGVMKPGDGKTHKECATLCIMGGIPPMLVTRDRLGTPTFYVLISETGGPLSVDAYPMIADPVEISGELERWGETLMLRVRASDIRRL